LPQPFFLFSRNRHPPIREELKRHSFSTKNTYFCLFISENNRVILKNGKTKAKAENVEPLTRKDLLDKMFDAGIKEKFSQLAREYNCELVLEVWTQIIKGGGVKKYFRKGEWKPEMTIEQALSLLDEYYSSIESLIQKRLQGGGGPPFPK
jgi:hypothetical protein